MTEPTDPRGPGWYLTFDKQQPIDAAVAIYRSKFHQEPPSVLDFQGKYWLEVPEGVRRANNKRWGLG